MTLSNISINKQSSIRIAGTKIIYFDAFQIDKGENDADIIFITHEHFDHFDPASIEKIINENTVIVAPKSMMDKVVELSFVSKEKCISLMPGDTTEIDGVLVKGIAAYNIGKPFHQKASGWLGYLVTMDGTTYYVAGDTDPNEDNRTVSCDVALIPIGGHYTMDKKQAVEFVQEINPKAVIPTHYGDVVGSPKDGKAFAKLMNGKGIQVEVLI